MSRYRALIVDDERLARSRMRGLLDAHPEVEVVAEADGVEAAARAIDEHDPDLIFLDIQMPGGSGFDLLEARDVGARVVFVTAHDEHAIRAFEVNALDYLLKPVARERLAETLARLPGAESGATLRMGDRVSVRVGRALRFFDLDALSYIGAAGDYSEAHLRGGESLLTDVSMQKWEQRLPRDFVRIHRSTIVNLHMIDEVRPAEGSTHEVLLRGTGAGLAVSRRHLAELKTRLGAIV